MLRRPIGAHCFCRYLKKQFSNSLAVIPNLSGDLVVKGI